MKTIGIFEAKTKLSELCADISENGERIMITRRGEPIAELHPPAPPQFSSVWEARRDYDKQHGPQDAETDFEIPERKPNGGNYGSWTDDL